MTGHRQRYVFVGIGCVRVCPPVLLVTVGGLVDLDATHHRNGYRPPPQRLPHTASYDPWGNSSPVVATCVCGGGGVGGVGGVGVGVCVSGISIACHMHSYHRIPSTPERRNDFKNLHAFRFFGRRVSAVCVTSESTAASGEQNARQ